jgi:hypothetical protein
MHRNGKSLFLLITLVVALCLQPLFSQQPGCPSHNGSSAPSNCPCPDMPDHQADCDAFDLRLCPSCSIGSVPQPMLPGAVPGPALNLSLATPADVSLILLPVTHTRLFRPPRS